MVVSQAALRPFTALLRWLEGSINSHLLGWFAVDISLHDHRGALSRSRMFAPGKKMPGARPGEVQQGGESDERISIFAFKDRDRVHIFSIQGKILN